MPFQFQAGHTYDVRLEYYRESGSTVAFQWSLIGGTDVGRKLAVAAAQETEATIAVVGSDTNTCGEGLDRSVLTLAGSQEPLLQAVRAAIGPSKPLIVVLLNGRSLSIDWSVANADAIIEGFYPGQAQGTAVAEVLFGDYNPAGRLPLTFPKAVGQLPIFYNYKPSARPKNYVELDSNPLFPFGYGLSYTQFSYSNLKVFPAVIPRDGKVFVSVDVRNTGKYDGEEVVQLYIRDEVSSVTTPIQSLRGFERIHFNVGEVKTVHFTLDAPRDLALLNLEWKWAVEPGIFNVYVGPSSAFLPARLTANFTVV
jgi:beta-glucosidase